MRLFFLIIFFTLGSSARAQAILDWSDLAQGIIWKPFKREAPLLGFQEADFTPKMEDLEGKQVTITGYLLIFAGSQSQYLLSKNPLASCFFCGNGGPETVLQLSFIEETPYRLDDLITVTGILRLNRDDPTNCYYLIEKAEAFRL